MPTVSDQGEPDPEIARAFSRIYATGSWKTAENQESASGRGSTLVRTAVVRRELPSRLERLGVRFLLDAGCGDFNWLRAVDLPLDGYLGVDVVPELIAANQALYGNDQRRFEVLDVASQRLPRTDAILCRECLVHLSFEHALTAIRNFARSGSRLLIATTHSVDENQDIVSGEWRFLNLLLPPFGLPEPEERIVEDAELGKSLGIWRIDSLPTRR